MPHNPITCLTSLLYYVKKPDEKTPRGVIPLEVRHYTSGAALSWAVVWRKDCIVDEIVPPEEVPSASDIKAGSNPSAQALSFKIGNRVPYKTVVKGSNPSAQALSFKIGNRVPYKTVVVHQSLILRADNMAEKQQWVARLRSHTKAFKEAPPPPPPSSSTGGDTDQSGDEGAGRDGDSAGAGGGSGGNIVPGALGQGGGGVAGAGRVVNPEEELRYQVTEVRRYVQAVLVHLADNIPKAIVLSQVERARDSMLTKLYQTVSSMSDDKLHSMLQEDAESAGKRDKFKRMRDAMLQLKRALSLHEARASAEDEGQARKIQAHVFKHLAVRFHPSLCHFRPSLCHFHPSLCHFHPSLCPVHSPPCFHLVSPGTKETVDAWRTAFNKAASAVTSISVHMRPLSLCHLPSRSSSANQQPPAITRGMTMGSVPNPLGAGVPGAMVPGPVMARGPPMVPSASTARSASPLRQTLAGGMDAGGGMGNPLRATSRRTPPAPPTGFSFK
ncbi:unnamed protein product [Closterium sp. Yama58-4]|nr:unnamed protein product [Closterium sp. Yama58-4]